MEANQAMLKVAELTARWYGFIEVSKHTINAERDSFGVISSWEQKQGWKATRWKFSRANTSTRNLRRRRTRANAVQRLRLICTSASRDLG